MKGLMMDFALTVPVLLRRAETLFGNKEIVTRLPDKSIHRCNYREMAARSRRLSSALHKLGVSSGDRVATLCWNHYQHLEMYFAIPCMGAVLHTLNLRLSPEDLAYIVNHANDKVIIVDQVLLPLLDKFKERIKPEQIIVVPNGTTPLPQGMLNYEALLAEAGPSGFTPFEGDENTAAAMCYTSGTTGQPKGVLYSHRSIVLHSMLSSFSDALAISEADIVLPVVPMFHVNAWGLPFTCTMAGCTLVFPGPHLDPPSLLELYEKEQVTVSAGVPTIWLGILGILDANPGKYNLKSIRCMLVGGSAAPRSMIAGFQERHGLRILHAWGMTETSPLGSVCGLTSEIRKKATDLQYDYRAKQGLAAPFVEMRIRNEEGIAPWDGKTMGELEVRGPWIAKAYYNTPDDDGKFTKDGWFRTGDIASIESNGYIEIKDRSKDVIKSGGEWISSVQLEGMLMGHPSVAEAAVFAIPSEKWMERPMAAIVLKEGKAVTKEELTRFLEPLVARFWLPDAYEFVKEIPKTSVGKFKKSALREMFKEYKA
ncbi:MAG: long-chain fatty acid--CoA ligase [Cyclobacteriaceae bacterium]|nr:long-chain fatty acid--CoA ligase [Cyclobacteriaceae bacterium]